MEKKYAILFLIVTMLLCGCSPKTKVTDTGRIYKLPLGECVVFSDDGYVHLDTGKWIMSFFDPVSGMDVPLCTRVNCTHNSKNCDAYFPSVNFAAIIDDHLYYIECSDGFMGKNLCMADTNGTNRRVLHHLESAQECDAAGCEEGYLFFTYHNQFDEHGNNLEKENCGICLMNLETGELEHIQMPENYRSRINQATISQGALYYEYYKYQYDMKAGSFEESIKLWDDPELRNISNENTWLEIFRYDLSSKESTCLLSKNANQTSALTIAYGHLFAHVHSGVGLDGKGRLEDLNTGDAYELEPELLNDRACCICDEGVVILDRENRKFLLWRYDTGKLETLGSYEEAVSPSILCITRDWVYAIQYTLPEPGANGEYIGHVYLSREQFMKGEYEWKPAPTRY